MQVKQPLYVIPTINKTQIYLQDVKTAKKTYFKQSDKFRIVSNQSNIPGISLELRGITY